MRKWSWLIAAALVLCMAASVGFAQTQDICLTIEYKWDETALSGAEFSVWKVAEVSSGPVFDPVDEFAGYGLDFTGYGAGEWRDTAMSLAVWVLRDGVGAQYRGKTDADGRLRLEGLSDGLYLIVGKKHGQGSWRYTPEPGMIVVPAMNDDGTTSSEVTVAPKKEREPVGPVDIGVRKEWIDDGHESERPEKVAVQLLSNGKVYDTVVLSEENSWQHVWEELDGGPDWSVAEKNVPEKYKDGYRRDGNTFVIKNTYQAPGKPPKDEVLPQTGLLWWPVPILAGAGMALCYMGWRSQRKDEEE